MPPRPGWLALAILMARVNGGPGYLGQHRDGGSSWAWPKQTWLQRKRRELKGLAT
jgi:hypothetical protein